MMKLILATPIALVILGVLALFAGDKVASAEEGIASSVGNLLSSKWVAIGLILAGALWFASEEGYLSKA